MSYCIYQIKDLRSDEVIYIGKTKDFKHRRSTHFTDKRSPIDKYMLEEGRENFEMSKIVDDIETNDDVVKIEDQYIVEFKPFMNKHRSGNITADMKEYEKSEKRKEYKKEYQKNYMKEYMKEYKQSEKRKEYLKEYYQKNKEQRLSYQKQYNQSEKAKERQNEYYQKNKEQKLSYQKQYNQKNKDYYLEYQRQYRLKKKQEKALDTITLF